MKTQEFEEYCNRNDYKVGEDWKGREKWIKQHKDMRKEKKLGEYDEQ